jgi:hypothetical protein
MIAAGLLALVLQCAGIGARMRGTTTHKPMVQLGDQGTPLTNIAEDIPPSIRLLLHVRPDTIPEYRAFFDERGTSGHSIEYVPQETSLLYDENGAPIRSGDGFMRASNGLMTFVRGTDALPEYVLVTGGPKVGIHMPDVEKALTLMAGDEDVEAVAFVRELTEDENRADLARWESGAVEDHPRYARVNVRAQRVYEHPHLCEEAFTDVHAWAALTGMYLFRTIPYTALVSRLARAIDDVEACILGREDVHTLEDVRRVAGMDDKMDLLDCSFMRTVAMDGSRYGMAYFLRTVRALWGYNGRPEGLSYRTLVQTEGHRMSIKRPEDIDRYLALVESGRLPGRS